jgi:hypothetical protein
MSAEISRNHQKIEVRASERRDILPLVGGFNFNLPLLVDHIDLRQQVLR